MKKKSHFADLKDDLPFSDTPQAAPPPADTWADQSQRIARNRSKNSGRKYKPQKGRMKLLMCDSCDWRVRCAQGRIDQIKFPGCPACGTGRLIQGD